MRLDEIQGLKNKPQLLSFRVSIDHPDEQKHDEARGEGNFALSWEVIKELNERGFPLSIARHRKKDENTAKVDRSYHRYFKKARLAKDTRIISFPDFLTPGAIAQVPHITKRCMTQYHNEEGRDQFMCNYSKMVVKKDGRMQVLACTLVDDDQDYYFGSTLKEAMGVRVMLKHHRCYSCFAQGASCSEM